MQLKSAAGMVVKDPMTPMAFPNLQGPSKMSRRSPFPHLTQTFESFSGPLQWSRRRTRRAHVRTLSKGGRINLDVRPCHNQKRTQSHRKGGIFQVPIAVPDFEFSTRRLLHGQRTAKGGKQKEPGSHERDEGQNPAQMPVGEEIMATTIKRE